MGRSRKSKSEKPPTAQAIHQHQRAKWGCSRDMKAIRGKAMPLLTKDEWGCLAEDIAWGDYKRSNPSSTDGDVPKETYGRQ